MIRHGLRWLLCGAGATALALVWWGWQHSGMALMQLGALC